jgi:hypothetical protein
VVAERLYFDVLPFGILRLDDFPCSLPVPICLAFWSPFLLPMT